MNSNNDEIFCTSGMRQPIDDLDTLARSHPSRPRLTVRVGVTGHRMDAMPPKGQDERLRDAISDVLKKIQVIVTEIYDQRIVNDLETYSCATPSLRVISPLAEGADRVVADEALELGFELQCPLPFHRDEYAKDFKTDSSKKEFTDLLGKAKKIFELDGPTTNEADRKKAYEMVGRTVLRQCDLLIAVWDQDRPSDVGGTGQIVQEALALGIPIIWIHPLLKWPPSLWETAQKAGEPGIRRDLSLLTKRLKNILQFPSLKNEKDAAQRFFEEDQPAWNHGFFFKAFCKVWAWAWSRPSLLIKDFQAAAREEWERTWKTLTLTDDAKVDATKPLDTGYLKPFAWADGLAEFYANKYRSSFVAAYLMGALAIFFAYRGSRPHAPPSYSITELALITLILAVTSWGRYQHWHQRWMDYRALAEEFRQVQFLSLLGLSTSSLKVPTHLEPGDPGNKWFGWYFKAISREQGLIQARLDSLYLDSYRRALEGWIVSQRNYHDRNAGHYHKICKNLQRTTQLLFFATFIFCILHLIIENHLAINNHIIVRDFGINSWLVLGTVVLPAFGGALGAILHIGEFERIALRSGALRNQLEKLACQLRCIGEAATSNDLGPLAQKFSDIALEELIDWRFAAIDKDLSLPA